jgi:hypothetical protein
MNDTPHRSPPGGVSPVICSTLVISYIPHIPQMRGKGCGDSSVSFDVFWDLSNHEKLVE